MARAAQAAKRGGQAPVERAQEPGALQARAAPQAHAQVERAREPEALQARADPQAHGQVWI
jgi:hypothetical protein